MKQRLFIAIQIPEKIKDKIEAALEKIRYSFTDDVRFIERNQWHITIAFFGYQEDIALAGIVKSLKAAVKDFSAPEIEFTDISYGPKDGLKRYSDRSADPAERDSDPKRMIWLNGSDKSSDVLAVLKEKLENALVDNGVVFKREHRRFRIHINLARFHTSHNLPKVEMPFKSNFQAANLDLMESHLKRSGAEYEILQSVKFSL